MLDFEHKSLRHRAGYSLRPRDEAWGFHIGRGITLRSPRPQRAVVVKTNDRQGACVRGEGCERALLLAVLKKRAMARGFARYEMGV